MVVDKKHKADAIQAYFEGIRKLKWLRTDDRDEAQLELNQLIKEINSVAVELENCKRLLSTLNIQENPALNKASIADIFTKGLFFDTKDSWSHINALEKRLTADEFELRDFLIYCLVIILLLSILLLICLSHFLDVCVSLLIAFFFYIFLTTKASKRRIENLLKAQEMFLIVCALLHPGLTAILLQQRHVLYLFLLCRTLHYGPNLLKFEILS